MHPALALTACGSALAQIYSGPSGGDAGIVLSNFRSAETPLLLVDDDRAPTAFDQVSQSNTKIARAQIDALEKALDQYRLDVGAYPATEQGLAALNSKPQNVEKWAGPYLKKAVPPDPWGNRYLSVVRRRCAMGSKRLHVASRMRDMNGRHRRQMTMAAPPVLKVRIEVDPWNVWCAAR